MLVLIGGTGIGLVWGWLMAAIGARTRRRWRTAALLAAATLAIALALFLLAGRSTLPFLGASALTLWLHLAWREGLRRRYGSTHVTREVIHA